MIGHTISHYEILEHLGSGGMGAVYKARDVKLDRVVALKFLPPELGRDSEAKQRFMDEARAPSSLQHENICVVYDIDETDDSRMFISMEYLEGETLKEKLEAGPLSVQEAVRITSQAARGLARAHESGIIHRDVKPANIIITKDRTVKLLDFGLAKAVSRPLLTKSGSTLGTAAYMSPEQARGDPVDHRTDIWSLGVVLYEMVTGRRPFGGDYDQAATGIGSQAGCHGESGSHHWPVSCQSAGVAIPKCGGSSGGARRVRTGGISRSRGRYNVDSRASVLGHRAGDRKQILQRRPDGRDHRQALKASQGQDHLACICYGVRKGREIGETYRR
jgi:serine/threonine protein kinase